jgi:type I restriction enzyme M protein
MAALSETSFIALLLSLGFTKKGFVYSKNIASATLSVDTAKKELIYPEDQGLTINERQTCNFSSPENFVVFECVHRLLEKGYHAKNIELEPKWKLGHGASGGRADILVRDNHGKAILIIECKTWGREFDKAWKATLNDGDQLFSYAQQISEVQFLCLYASTVEESGALVYKSHVIAHRDNEKYLEENKLKGFAKANDVQARYATWRDTYKQDYTSTGIFEPNVQPYKIGEAKLTAADLRPISVSDRQRQYHEFATILRQHNVSGRENAFDKLVNLFLCKLVDEMRNPNDLRFYWRGVAYDTHFDLLDRLQQLYSQGMKEFLKEDITYINEADVKKALRLIKSKPDATQRSVWRLFRRQKFFTNNDFSFIEVHNEKLFFQNAEVLLKVLQMWQDIRLVDDSGHNQFLGDMFEGFLDQGVKQSEGQFFTPMPICRFLMMSLPLESIVKGRNTPPRAIDYACGAGHFLTELALQMKPLVAQHQPQAHLDDYHAAIFGIEKEYRLSKIAKVSAYMYGQPGIRICYGDALMHEHPNFTDIQNGSFDLLVANPPFSVTGFLETLPGAERSRYRLTSTINDLDTANSIETFFIERAAQLLAPGGIAAIILPASILSNGGSAYVTAREVLIQSFDIVAIAELGSGTFGKTGTNTVTLFMRRKANDPDPAEHYRERIAEWFSGPHNDKRKAAVYRDAHLIAAYTSHIGSTEADYKTLLSGQPNATLLAHDTFKSYRKTFDESAEVKNLTKQKKFKDLPLAEQTAELTKRFLANVTAIEADKLLHFILAHEQPNQVLILRSPTDTKDQKKFLGYEWSAAKGSEGIKLIKDVAGKHLTPLFDETNRDNATKINHAIARNFDGTLTTIPAELEPYLLLLPMVDLLDFSRVGFEKQVLLNARRRTPIQSQWPLATVTALAEIISGGTPDTTCAGYWDGDIPWLSVADFGKRLRYVDSAEKTITAEGLANSSTKLLKPDDIIISARGTVGAMAQLAKPMAFNQSCYGLRARSAVSPAYLFYVLRHEIEQLRDQATGSKFDAITMKTFDEVLLPLADVATQRSLVTECEAVDEETEAAQACITASKAEIERIVKGIYASNAPRCEIGSVSLNVQYGLSEKMNEGGVGYRIFRMNEIINGRMHDNGSMKCADITSEEFAALKLNRGDVLFNRTNSIEHVGKTGLFDLDGDYCFASYLVRIVPDQKQVLPLFLTQMMNSVEFQTEAKSKASKSINQANINATIMRNMKVPVPSLPQQAKAVQAIEVQEHKIIEAESAITSAPAKKEAILKKYLQ